MVVAVVEAVDAEAIKVVVVANLLQTLAELISALSLTNALTHEERKKHIDEGLCFTCHKKGHRLFQCPELKGKAAIGVPPSKKQ
jgi:cbb3-type cytochrome oxidase cytochrome c subunit